MQKAIKHVIFLYMLFLALLFFSGGAEGAAYTALYYIAFLLPLCIMLGLYRRDKYEREQERGLREEWIQPLKPSVLGFRLTLPLIAPTVLFTLLLSNLIGLLLTSLGFEAPTNEVGNLARDLLSSALAPAVLEEMLFRLAPLMLVAPRCRRKAFVLSTVCFALSIMLAHCCWVSCRIQEISCRYRSAVAWAAVRRLVMEAAASAMEPAFSKRIRLSSRACFRESISS